MRHSLALSTLLLGVFLSNANAAGNTYTTANLSPYSGIDNSYAPEGAATFQDRLTIDQNLIVPEGQPALAIWMPVTVTVATQSVISGQAGVVFATSGAKVSFINYGTIEAKINEQIDREGYALIGFDVPLFGTNLQFQNAGTIRGNIDVRNAMDPESNFYNNSGGNIYLPYNANETTNSSTKFVRYTQFAYDDTGLHIGVHTDGTTVTYTQVQATSFAFQYASNLYVDVSGTDENIKLLNGTTLSKVLSSTEAIKIGRYNGLGIVNDPALKIRILDNSALIDFRYILLDGGKQLDLNAYQSKSISQSATIGGANKASLASANALEKISNAGTYTRMDSTISSLNTLLSDTAVAKAVGTLAPTTTTSSAKAASQISAGISGVIATQQNRSGSGLNAGDYIQFDDKTMWVKTFGSLGKQHDKDGENGFDTNAYGLGIGADGEYTKDQKIGLAMFYTRANVDVNNVDQTSNMDVISAIVYGSNLFGDNATTLSYQAGYSWQKTSSDRQLFTGETASADYTSTTASLDVKLAHKFDIDSKLSISPKIGTTYRYFNNPAYSETGVGANLIVDKFSTTELLGNAGAEVSYKLAEKSSIVANLSAGYNFRDTTNNVSSAFEGASDVRFDSQSIDNGRWRYEAGLGYDARINEVSSINVSYDFQAQGTDFTNNVLSAKYEYKF